MSSEAKVKRSLALLLAVSCMAAAWARIGTGRWPHVTVPLDHSVTFHTTSATPHCQASLKPSHSNHVQRNNAKVCHARGPNTTITVCHNPAPVLHTSAWRGVRLSWTVGGSSSRRCFIAHGALIVYECSDRTAVRIYARFEFFSIVGWSDYQFSVFQHAQRVPDTSKLSKAPISLVFDKYTAHQRSQSIIGLPPTVMFTTTIEPGDRISIFYRIRRIMYADERPCIDRLLHGSLQIVDFG